MPGANGYVGGKVLYIDTENTFRPDRLRPIAQRFNLDEDTVLENVMYARAFTSVSNLLTRNRCNYGQPRCLVQIVRMNNLK